MNIADSIIKDTLERLFSLHSLLAFFVGSSGIIFYLTINRILSQMLFHRIRNYRNVVHKYCVDQTRYDEIENKVKEILPTQNVREIENLKPIINNKIYQMTILLEEVKSGKVEFKPQSGVKISGIPEGKRKSLVDEIAEDVLNQLEENYYLVNANSFADSITANVATMKLGDSLNKLAVIPLKNKLTMSSNSITRYNAAKSLCRIANNPRADIQEKRVIIKILLKIAEDITDDLHERVQELVVNRG